MYKKYFKHFVFVVVITFALTAISHHQIEKSNVKGLSTSPEQKEIKGIILPHHELAKEYIIVSLEHISPKIKI